MVPRASPPGARRHRASALGLRTRRFSKQMGRKVGRKPGLVSIALFLIVAGAMLGGITVLFAAFEGERGHRANATRTNEILLAMQAVHTAALNGETGQRGYFITADKRYLEPYHLGQQQAPLAVARLRALTAEGSGPGRRELVDEIVRLSDTKWAEMGDTVQLVEKGRIAEAHNRILSDEGQLAMLRLRTAIARLERIERAVLARAGQRTAEAEGRIVPALAVLSAILVVALALGLWLVTRTARMEAAAANAHAIAQARDRADLLAHELNHRVKNLFAVILAIVKMSGRDVPQAKPVVERISGRIHALSRAHDVTQGRSADGNISLRTLVETAVAPYVSESAQCDAKGDDITLGDRNAVPMGLILHELVTNTVKYGAWSAPGGTVHIRWRGLERGDAEGRAVLEWTEEGSQPVRQQPAQSGFGTMLIESAVRQMNGKMERTYHPHGIAVRVEFVPEADFAA